MKTNFWSFWEWPFYTGFTVCCSWVQRVIRQVYWLSARKLNLRSEPPQGTVMCLWEWGTVLCLDKDWFNPENFSTWLKNVVSLGKTSSTQETSRHDWKMLCPWGRLVQPRKLLEMTENCCDLGEDWFNPGNFSIWLKTVVTLGKTGSTQETSQYDWKLLWPWGRLVQPRKLLNMTENCCVLGEDWFNPGNFSIWLKTVVTLGKTGSTQETSQYDWKLLWPWGRLVQPRKLLEMTENCCVLGEDWLNLGNFRTWMKNLWLGYKSINSNKWSKIVIRIRILNRLLPLLPIGYPHFSVK